MFHIFLHIIIPFLMSFFCIKRSQWLSIDQLKIYIIMMCAMLIDLDHLLADPIYDPSRCSIGFHPLHQIPAIVVYGMLTVIPKTRILGIGLMIHIILDGIDCSFM